MKRPKDASVINAKIAALHTELDELATEAGSLASARQRKGLCCSFTDGLRIETSDYDTKDGHFRVRLNGRWIDVPEAALVLEPNRDGRAFVWPYQDAKGETQIRCFLSGAGA